MLETIRIVPSRSTFNPICQVKSCVYRNNTLSIQQHVTGSIDLGREVIGAAVVGMELLHQPPVRCPDGLGVGAGGEAEDLVRLLDRDVGAAARRRSAR